jgi:hypothetical protein
MSFRGRPTCPNSWTPPQQNTPSVVKNQDKNHENEKAAPQKAQIESIEDLASTFSTVSVNNGYGGRSTGTSPVPPIADDFVHRPSRLRWAKFRHGHLPQSRLRIAVLSATLARQLGEA